MDTQLYIVRELMFIVCVYCMCTHCVVDCKLMYQYLDCSGHFRLFWFQIGRSGTCRTLLP